MIKYSGVYEIVNLINGKRYIGSSNNLKNRARQHIEALRRGQHCCPHLQSSFDKYGEAAFEFRPILYCDAEMALTYEQMLLDAFSPEYNTASCAEAPMRGTKCSDETKAKISASKKGTIPSEEHRAKISASLIGNTRRRGKKMSEEAKRKISIGNTGYKMTERELEILSERSKGNQYGLGYKHTEEARAKISAAKRNPSDETRAKLSEMQKRRWAQARLNRMAKLEEIS